MRYFLFFVVLFFGFSTRAQHQDKVDFIAAKTSIVPIPQKKQIKGTVVYRFNVLSDVDSVFLDARNMEFSDVLLNHRNVKYTYDGKKIWVHKKLKRDRSYSLSLQYLARPKQTVYFLGWVDSAMDNARSLRTKKQIWTQGQGKYTSHWLPSFDDMSEKVVFDVTIVSPSDFEVVANGKLVSATVDAPSRITKTWKFHMQNPMSSYLLAFAIGNYKKQVLTASSGIPIENYYYPSDSLKAEPTYRYTRKIFDFLESEIGVPYPWQNYKQIPVHDFLYAGMENTTATIFSDGYMIDSTAFVDKNYVNVNAHELAHQWFGDLVTEKNGSHHWLQEGFATYYAYLAEKKIFGEDYFYWKLYRSALKLQEQVKKGKGQRLTDPKASSLVFYEKGALALFMLKEQIGERNFRKGIQNYLNAYRFKNATIQNFLLAMEQASETDLSDYEKRWLESREFPFEALKSVFKKSSESLRLLFAMENEHQRNPNGDLDYASYWNKTNSVPFKRYMVEKYHHILPKTVIDRAFASKALPVRQALALHLDSLTLENKSKFESLLEDKSYITIERALFKLWMAFPAKRIAYLSKTKDIIGLPNKNVRLLWLTLAILTPNFEAGNTHNYFQELNEYTAPAYSWEIRMGAFRYLKDAIGLNDGVLLNLIQASTHHSWQFRKFARNLLEELLQDSDYSVRIEKLSQKLKGEELRYIHTKLNK